MNSQLSPLAMHLGDFPSRNGSSPSPKLSRTDRPAGCNLNLGILKVTKDEQKVIRFLEGHGEKRIDNFEDLVLIEYILQVALD